MNSLIIGMGIGQLYKNVLEEMGHIVTTVDIDVEKRPNFTSLDDALNHMQYDTVHICTPNVLHLPLALQVAPHKPKLCFIEKPGFEFASEWEELVYRFPSTRWNLVKNNQYRDGLHGLRVFARDASRISISWENKNRVPSPGSWFTTKSKAFGGVSRDLMPHLLSFLTFLFPDDYQKLKLVQHHKIQRWSLETVSDTEYGSVNMNGVYDVDDHAILSYRYNDTFIPLHASWKNNYLNVRHIEIDWANDPDSGVQYNFGLCPESAYQKMIETNLKKIFDDEFWDQQLSENIWIHKQMELL